MLEMSDFCSDISDEDTSRLQEIIRSNFSLESVPTLAIVENNSNSYGEFKDILAFDGVPYFIRADADSNTIYKKQQHGYTPALESPLGEGEKGDLYAFFEVNKSFADDELKTRATKEFYDNFGNGGDL